MGEDIRVHRTHRSLATNYFKETEDFKMQGGGCN